METAIRQSESLTAVAVSAATTTSPSVKTDYVDQSGVSKTSWTALNGTSAVTLLTGVAGPNVLAVKSISMYNNDTVATVVTLSHVVSSTSYPITKQSLAVGDTLVIDSSGIRVLDSSGQVKQAGALNVSSALPGPFTGSVGASTAAAGSSTSDAGALPAGTGNILPTTGADDTKGVKINVADQVTGRMLWIGNGVSNKIIKVYAPTGGAINGAAADAAFSSASGKGVLIICLSSAGNTWLAQ